MYYYYYTVHCVTFCCRSAHMATRRIKFWCGNTRHLYRLQNSPDTHFEFFIWYVQVCFYICIRCSALCHNKHDSRCSIQYLLQFQVCGSPSNRDHWSKGDHLEGKRENYWVCSVQYNVQHLCTVQCTHYWTGLTIVCWLFLAFLWLYCVLEFVSVRFSFLGLFCLVVYLCMSAFVVMASWPPYVADANIIFLPCGFFYLSFLFFSFSLT